MKLLSIPGLATLALCTGLLAGCGGGGSASLETPSTGSVPAILSSSVGALIAFAKSLVSDDTAEPLSLGTVEPAVDDTAEPAGL